MHMRKGPAPMKYLSPGPGSSAQMKKLQYRG